MLTTLYYCLQVFLCSAIMMGYYWLVLRDKKFHQYNRFYLMAIAVLSWIVPLIKIQWQQPIEADSTIYYLLSSVASNNTDIDVTLQSKWYNLNWQTSLTIVYAAISLILLTGMVTALIRIYRLLKNNSCKSLGEVFVVLTNANGTPFSFFSYIFWNDAIDLKSDAGKQILQHELTHVKQKHSIDKILIQLVLVVGWFNPFFWLIKKEMDMIHEFIADQHTIKNGDAASLAEMLLAALYPQKKYLLANPFFFSPIKRRIQMIKNNSTPKYSYMRRLVILPLLAIVVVLFAFRNKENAKPISMGTLIENIADVVKEQKEKYTGKIQLKEITLKQSYTIVINPSHGGADKGAIAVDRKTTESALTLSLAKVIKEINTNEKINILLTRENDVYQSVVEVNDFTIQQKADLFISLHYNAASPVKEAGKPSKENPTNGTEIYLYPNSIINQNNYLLANSIANKINQLEIPFNGIKTRKEGIYVLKNATIPSVLLEAGYISNTKDFNTINETGFQKDLAASILNGIQQYLLVKENKVNGKDTIILNSDSVYVVPDNKKITIVSPNGTSSFSSNGKADFSKEKISKFGLAGSMNAVCYLDGKKVDNHTLNEMNPNAIESVSVLKGQSAIALYGEEGKNGVVLITSKKEYKQEGGKIATEGSTFRFENGKKVDDGEGYLKMVNKSTAIVLDGNEISKEVASKLDIRDIRTIGFGDFPIEKVMKHDVLILQTNKGIRATQNSYSKDLLLKLEEFEIQKKSITDSLAYAKKFNKTFNEMDGVIYIVDGKILSKETIKNIAPQNIKSMTVIKGENAVKIYGTAAKDGIIEITTKNLLVREGYDITDVQLEKLDSSKVVRGYKIEPDKSKVNNSFAEKIKAGNSSIKNVYFYEGSRNLNIQYKDGTQEIYNLKNTESRNKAEKKYGIKLAPPPPPDIRKSKELPVVNVQLESLGDSKVAEITPIAKEDNDKVFTVTQEPASFPGGKDAWQKYLDRNLNKNIPVEKGAPPGKYTVIVDFIVKLDGTLANIKASNSPGYGTAEEAMRMISKGPKWIPATQNGKPVVYRVKQSITFLVSED